jgi:CBS domain-containing protein/nucleotide-binding universal stress UspA family protein
MYKHILVALDGSPESEQALKQAIALASLAGASLTGISVIEKLPAYAASVGEVQEMKNEFEVFFAGVQENAVKAAKAGEVDMKTIIRAGNAAHTIVHYAEETGVDLIVMGAIGRRGLGGTADKVTENAACSVLVARVSLPSLRVRDVMTREVTSVSPSTPLSHVVELLIEKGLKATPVVENGKIIGIITGGDLLTRAGMGLRISLQRILPADIFSEQIRQLAEEGKTAKDIMTSPVVTIGADEHVTKAAALMSEKNIKRLPVLNKQGELVGIISRLDILALVASGGPSSELFPAIAGASARTAGDIMLRNVPIVALDANLNEVINKILSTPLRRVAVTDEGRHVLGIILDTDLVKATPHKKAGWLPNILSRFSNAPTDLVNFTEKASEVMSRDVFSVQPDTPLTDVIRLMIDKQIKRLVVTDEEKRLVGMVSRESILRVLISNI